MTIRYRLLPLACCFLISNASITEIDSMQKVSMTCRRMRAHNQIPLVVFDIDDTLATTERELGSNAWFCHELKKYGANFNNLIALYTHIHNHIPLKPVETHTPLLIQSLQSFNIPCIALTARSLLIERTFEQLRPLSINFTELSQERLNLSDNPSLPAQYMGGIIFNGDNNKGETLLKYLRHIDYKPKHVIFVDDSLSHVEKVERALENAGIKCSAFHYRHESITNRPFDAEEAQRQLNAFLREHPFKATA